MADLWRVILVGLLAAAWILLTVAEASFAIRPTRERLARADRVVLALGMVMTLGMASIPYGIAKGLETKRQDTKRPHSKILLIPFVLGAVSVWISGTLGASFGVQLLILMAVVYASSWATLVVAVWIRRRTHGAT